MIKNIYRLLILVVCLSAVSACGTICPLPDSSDKQITGEVVYLNKMALPENAKVVVTLYDASLQDVAAKKLAEETILPKGKQVPIPFVLNYDPASVEKRHSYGVRASIYVDEKLWFTSTSFQAVDLENSVPSKITIKLDRVN